MVDGKTEIFRITLYQLLPGKWLDNWMIMAAIQMCDKLPFVHCGQSVPLDNPNENGIYEPVCEPLARWRKKIDTLGCTAIGP
jgi:hypothetical protein